LGFFCSRGSETCHTLRGAVQRVKGERLATPSRLSRNNQTNLTHKSR
jgi:hypothetical protein